MNSAHSSNTLNLSLRALIMCQKTRLTAVINKGCYRRPLGTQKGPWAEFGGKSFAEAVFQLSNDTSGRLFEIWVFGGSPGVGRNTPHPEAMA